MATLRSIRERLSYDLTLRLDRFGHLYIPLSLGSMRATAYGESDGVRITLFPYGGGQVQRLYVMPRQFWKLVLPEKGELLVFFRREGTTYRGFVPFINKEKEKSK
jgi:hypothetical protein